MNFQKKLKYHLPVALFLFSVNFLFIGCKSKNYESGWQYSSKPKPSLISKDTTTVILKIDFYRDCTESDFRYFSAKSEGKHMKVSYKSLLTSDKGQTFSIPKDSFFNALSLFEKACAEHLGCGGYAGGTGVSIEKHYKGMMTNFKYCQDYGSDQGWNGLEYFFGLMEKKLVDYPFK